MTPPRHSVWAAPLCMVSGAAFLVFNDALIKLFTADLPVGQIIAFRALATMACCVALMAKTRPPLPRLRDRDLLIRTGFTVANVFAFVAAVTVLPFSLAVFVDLTNILFVAVLAPVFLPERMTPWKLAAVGTGLAGAAVMLSLEAG